MVALSLLSTSFPAHAKRRKHVLGLSLALACVLFLALAALATTISNQRHHEQESRLPNTSSLALGASEIRKHAAVNSPHVLNVHVVPHTHDDVGWLKTVEQYYGGLNMTIQHACVRDILDAVVDSLLDNPSRTFTYVEQKFFSMWWNEQTDAVKDSVRFLVANQQLSFVNGGWCMHDEASTHFMGMIDQTTLGHEFLKRELGVIPKVGWQLDPFGHSATQASLLTSRAGLDALYFGRIDYQDLDIRHKTQECEGLWSSSAAMPNDTVFWGLTGSYSGNYGSPRGFCFDVLCHDDLLLNMSKTARLDKVNVFLDELKEQSDRTKGNHILLTMGEDFNYQRGNTYFANLDVLVGAVQKYQKWDFVNVSSIMGPRFDRVNIFYSSPDYYTTMKYKEAVSNNTAEQRMYNGAEDPQLIDQSTGLWSEKKDDFFPYSDCAHCFWTGYFTSRASFKRMERVGSSFLLAARQIEALQESNSSSEFSTGMGCSKDGSAIGKCHCDEPLYDLEDALGIVQHHDAVSGTAKQHVANDYSRRLQAGIDKASTYVTEKLKRVFVNASDADSVLKNLSFCQLTNETICKVSQEATRKNGTDVYVIVYNGLGSNRSSVVRLPVSVEANFKVTRLDSDATPDTMRSVSCPFVTSAYVLTFGSGHLPPLGATVFRISRSDKEPKLDQNPFAETETTPSAQASSIRMLEHANDTQDLSIKNGLLTVKFDRTTGMMKSISSSGTHMNISQTWGYYTSFDNTVDKSDDGSARRDQNSGAYVFRPSKPDQRMHPIAHSSKGIKVVQTAVSVEIHTVFEESWVSQVTRVEKGVPFVEVEYQIGPIPIDDARGKEVVTRYSTNIANNATFYTDSNGREFLMRRRDFRPSWPLKVYEPVAGNFYPVNAAIYIEDQNASMAILADRTQAGASLTDGSIELMAQRRTLVDDSRGVAEPMNETDGGVTPYPPYGKAERYGDGIIIRGKHRIMVGGGSSGASLARSQMDEAFSEPLLFVASAPSGTKVPFQRHSFSALQSTLPPNVMLITFKMTTSDEYLIRLGHQYSIGEDKALSSPVQLDLSQLFAGFKVSSAEEVTLTGNQKYNDWVKRRMDWTGSGPLPKSDVDGSNTKVLLNPMEIRTFVLKLVPEVEAPSTTLE